MVNEEPPAATEDKGGSVDDAGSVAGRATPGNPPEHIWKVLRARFDPHESWQLGNWIAYAFKIVLNRPPTFDEAERWAEAVITRCDLDEYPDAVAESVLSRYPKINGSPLERSFLLAEEQPWPPGNYGQRMRVMLSLVNELSGGSEDVVFILHQPTLAGLFGVSQPAISKMIGRMKMEGWVKQLSGGSYSEHQAAEYRVGKLPTPDDTGITSHTGITDDTGITPAEPPQNELSRPVVPGFKGSQGSQGSQDLHGLKSLKDNKDAGSNSDTGITCGTAAERWVWCRDQLVEVVRGLYGVGSYRSIARRLSSFKVKNELPADFEQAVARVAEFRKADPGRFTQVDDVMAELRTQADLLRSGAE